MPTAICGVCGRLHKDIPTAAACDHQRVYEITNICAFCGCGEENFHIKVTPIPEPIELCKDCGEELFGALFRAFHG